LDKGQKGRDSLAVASGNPSPLLEFEKGVLNDVAQLVKMGVVFALLFAVFLGRDDGVHGVVLRVSHDGIRIEGFVGDEVVGLQALYEGQSLATVSA